MVVLLYNSENYVGPCLTSLAGSHYPSLEIVLPDNASRDKSLEAAQRAARELGMTVSLMPLRTNLGCAGGNNAGWRASRGEIVVFLNPDTEIAPDFIEELIAPMQRDASIGITGAKIFYPQGNTLQHAGGFLHPNAMSEHYGAGQQDTGQFDEERDVDYVTGAGFAVRRDLLERLGGFDEDFFPAYFEETDLCLRARRSGQRVVYVPTARLVHHESVSLTANSPAFHRLYQRMRIRFCLKNYSLKDWVTRFIPFEIHWMLREPYARGHRLEQFRAYAEGLSWLARRGFKAQSTPSKGR